MKDSKKKNLVEVDGVLYEKTLKFGNRKRLKIHKNKKSYNRKNHENLSEETEESI